MSTVPADWAALLVDAVNKPGVISTAYSRFWNYSVGNQLLALWQCTFRNLEPGPINTFRGWSDLGRYVKKGEKALTLCMPVTVKRKLEPADVVVGDGAERPPSNVSFTRFVYRANWFMLCQTDGKEYAPTEFPEWNEATALSTLQVERVQFKHLNGNAQGYAVDREIAVSPIAAMPNKTLFHELAHVVLGPPIRPSPSDRSFQVMSTIPLPRVFRPEGASMPAQRQNAAAANSNVPVHQIRHRNIKAAIWKNQTSNGPMHDVRVTRSYKEGDEWRDSHSFGYDDLLIVAKLMYDAHSFITAERAKDQTGSRPAKPRERSAPPTTK